MWRRRFVLWSLVVTLLLWSGLGRAQQPKPGGTLRLALQAIRAACDDAGIRTLIREERREGDTSMAVAAYPRQRGWRGWTGWRR